MSQVQLFHVIVFIVHFKDALRQEVSRYLAQVPDSVFRPVYADAASDEVFRLDLGNFLLQYQEVCLTMFYTSGRASSILMSM